MSVTAPHEAGPRSVAIRGRAYPIRLPSIRDARLHVAGVIITVQVLGQVSLGFELSIAQLLACVGTCAVIEFVIVLLTQHVVAWPASALLTGNGVALLLRVDGTRHGQWWSVRGLHIFVATAAISVVSKYVIRWRGRPLFNPSNIGLVLCFLVLGSGRVNPLDFWWAPLSAPMIAAYAVIVAGGLVVTMRLQMLAASLAFWLTFAAGSASLAQRGHCFRARWHVGPVCDLSLWRILVTSPEILIFAFFMITDPKTAPMGRNARVVYGALIGIVATIFMSTQSTEFGMKVAVLGSLVAICACRPIIEALVPVSPNHGREVSPKLPWITAAGLITSLGAVLLIPVHDLRSPPRETFVLSETPPTVNVSDIPPLSIATAVRRLDNAPSDDRAREMAGLVMAHLQVVAQAIDARDESLAAAVMTERALDQLEQRITSSSAPHYQFDRLALVVMRDRRSTQASPTLAIRAEGVVAGTTTRADRVYALSLVDDLVLIDGDYDAVSVILD